VELHVYGFLYHEENRPYYAVVQAPDQETAATALLTQRARAGGDGLTLVAGVDFLQETPVLPGRVDVLTTIVLDQRA
jgi:hypothetical protein